MHHQMDYNGQILKCGSRVDFKATSGLPGSQLPKNQCIPEGFYKIFLGNHGLAKDDGKGICKLMPSWGIQSISSGKKAGECEPYWANWGKNRARMEPADLATKSKCSPIKRGGFYLHDSTKGYSHGCIEVETRIFPLLRAFNKATKNNTIVIKVQYNKGVATNGGTKV
ncbi:MAG: DUF2778 domain-containing protein [Alteromonadales bacterium]|nr:DUF2778 domain-containing protein [Alteromonadales bacterium]